MPTLTIGTKSNTPEFMTLQSSRLNRHGLIAGATGTGKTVTLHSLAEQCARLGSAVWVCDVKGDLAGISQPGTGPSWVTGRYQAAGVNYSPTANPTTFWDIHGQGGFPARLTLAELGPLLMARLLGLNPTQTGVLQIVFRVADDQQLPLLDLADLRALLAYVAENAKPIGTTYGHVATASLSAIQRSLLELEEQGAQALLGEPALAVADLIMARGMVNVLDARQLMQTPRIYGTFLLYLLSELFEDLPEIGDTDLPKLVLFFDEAHLLFADTPKPLLEKIEHVVRLIRSKGVGVYFCTQQPSDIPETILAQLGNRFQHALRAATPQGQNDIRVAATTMASNPAFRTADVLPNLGIGEALVSVLDTNGNPTPVERVTILPPQSRVGPVTDAERATTQAQSPFKGKYETPINRESAAEQLAQRLSNQPVNTSPSATSSTSKRGLVEEILLGNGRRQGLVEAATKAVVRQVASQAARAVLRGVLGTFTRR
jgi:DNA helicase HerA-like ATPase